MSTKAEFNEFEPRLKSAKNRFQLSALIIQTGQTPDSNIFRRRHSIIPVKPRVLVETL